MHHTRWNRLAARRRQAGAALLTAMVIVTLVASLSSAMLWRQWRAVEIEAAERNRLQSAWMLQGALDWARIILSEDAAQDGVDHLGEPWAVPLAEVRLASFLAADQNNTDAGPDAYLSGAIADLQGRYNLRNLVHGGELVPREVSSLGRLLTAVGLPSDITPKLAAQVLRSLPRTKAEKAVSPTSPPEAIVPPGVDDLGWLGLDAVTVKKLKPFVALLPEITTVNINTAPREVLVAASEGLDLATADLLIQHRRTAPFKSFNDVSAVVGASRQLDTERLGFKSEFFEIRGRMRLDNRIQEECSVVQRRGRETVVLRRQRLNLTESQAAGS